MNLREAASALRSAADAAPERLRQAEAESVRDAYDTARKNSSGRATRADLARRDHPYAKRHPEPLADPDVVNVGDGPDGGAFLAGWEETPPVIEGDTIRGHAENVDPKARQFLEPGTESMVARRPDLKTLREIEPRRERRISDAMAELLPGG